MSKETMELINQEEYKVYISETDYGGVVFFANYLKYAEAAKADTLANIGVNQVKIHREDHQGFIVKHVEADYKVPLTLDDHAIVKVYLVRLRSVAVTLYYEIFSKTTDTLSATLTIENAYIDTQTMRPVKMPDLVKQAFQKNA